MFNNIAIIGSGAIGIAFANSLAKSHVDTKINLFARKIIKFDYNNISSYQIDYHNESSMEAAANTATVNLALDLIIVATGILHDDKVVPEKSLAQLSSENFQHVFAINTIVPAMIAKYFIPKLNKNTRSIFAALSARVGSISDNKLGGWYAYRASKAALNMIIKNLAIETNRKNKNAIIVGLHPGTVNSKLSEPFQKNIAKDHLFEPEYSVEKLLNVLNNLVVADSGKFFAWDGEEIQP